MGKQVKRIELGSIRCESKTGDIIDKSKNLDVNLVAHRNSEIEVITINSYDKKFDRVIFFSIVK